MKKLPSRRATYLIGFIIIVALLGFAIYLEVFQGIQPCPLCILQRICLAIIGIIFLIGALFKFKKFGNFIVGSSAFLMSLAGALLAGRQSWLQHNPSGLTSNCDVSFQYMLQAMPFDQVVMKILQGGTECSQVNWEVFHLSLADLSLCGFVIFLCITVWQLCRKL